MQSVHVSRVIAADPRRVYEFAVDARHLPLWAAGLAQGELVIDGDRVHLDSPMGRVEVRFVARNTLGVIDHDVTLPSGTTVTNPMRVLAHPQGAEIVFTVRQVELTDADFARDVAAVCADLDRLAALIEADRGARG